LRNVAQEVANRMLIEMLLNLSPDARGREKSCGAGVPCM
jgi:hypothetical protein